MKIEKALQIMRREWENIRLSLRTCGDIGEFDSNSFINTGSDWLSLIKNVVEMEYRLPNYGYYTHQAAYVFSALASKAGERLGLTDEFAESFGSGYSWVRTGCFYIDDSMQEHHITKQMFFLKLFSPLGGNFTGWNFRSPIVMTKMKLVFHTFVKWQDSPQSYTQDAREYKAQIEPVWRGLSLNLGLPQEFPE